MNEYNPGPFEELAIEQETVQCAMGPNWQRVFEDTKGILEQFMNDSLIQIIIDYYGLAPVMRNFAAYFSPVTGGNSFIETKYPLGGYIYMCFACGGLSSKKELTLAFSRCFPNDSFEFNSIKMRQFCPACWLFKPDELIKDGKLAIDWNAKKVIGWNRGKIVACNDSARAAFLCIGKDWNIYKGSECEWFQRCPDRLSKISNADKYIPKD